MSVPIRNPLTEAHCNDLTWVLSNFPGFQATLEALERCGLPCQEQLEFIKSRYNICTAIQKEFNPLAPAIPWPSQVQKSIQLNGQQCRDVDSVIQLYPHLKATLEALERCGLPCEEQRTIIDMQYGICGGLKREFNPLES